MRTKITQQVQVSGNWIGLLDAHSFTGDHHTVVNIAGPGQGKAINFIR